MNLTLRHYQTGCIEAVRTAKALGIRRVLYVLPTGSGKTVTFAEIVRDAIQNDPDGRPALIIAHRDELLDQARDTIAASIPGVRVEFERGKDRASCQAQVIVASIQTIARSGTSRLDWLAATGASVVVYDECHHAAAEGAEQALERMGCFRAAQDRHASFLVGCTATDERLDNKRLEGGTDGGTVFQECVYRYPLIDAIREGYLSDYRGYVVRSETDLSAVRTVHGDFAEGELAKVLEADDARTGKAIEHWQEVAKDRCTIAFCVSVQHAQATAQAWRDAGYRAEAIDGDMHPDTRREIINRFRRGATQILCNCLLATEGFDHKPIACVVMLRPTQSGALYKQMAGRGSRTSPETRKTDCILLDVVDNCIKHSLMTAPRLLDMPQGIDLAGESLLTAREQLDALGAKASYLPKEGGTWSTIRTKAMEVQLFSVPRVPDEILAAGARMRWLKLPQGYLLYAGTADDGMYGLWRGAWIREAPLGYDWELIERPRSGGQERRVLFGTGETLQQAVWQVEYNARYEFRDTIGMAKTSTAWNSEPPSPSQLQYLSRLVKEARLQGFDAAMITTKGEASAAITHLKTLSESAAPDAPRRVTPAPAPRPIAGMESGRQGTPDPEPLVIQPDLPQKIKDRLAKFSGAYTR